MENKKYRIIFRKFRVVFFFLVFICRTSDAHDEIQHPKSLRYSLIHEIMIWECWTLSKKFCMLNEVRNRITCFSNVFIVDELALFDGTYQQSVPSR